MSSTFSNRYMLSITNQLSVSIERKRLLTGFDKITTARM